MEYLTNADLQLRLGNEAYVQMSDDNNDGAADTAVVDEARLAAEAELNSYLSVRYAVPIDLAVYPDLANALKSKALDLAEYRLRLRRPPVSADAIRVQRETVEWLKGVSRGEIELPAITLPAANAARGSIGEVSSAERLLTREELERS